MRVRTAAVAAAAVAAAAAAASSPYVPRLHTPPAGCTSNASWWYETTAHGAGFHDVTRFGAKGDGITDDTAAIIAALTTGRKPVYTVATPTAVYFPAGTYIVTKSLPIFFYTFISGSPCGTSVIMVPNAANFLGYVFDGDSGAGEWSEDDDQFYRGISHLSIVVGTGNPGATGIHWAQSQAAHLRNVTIDMSAGGKAGLFGENGSGGFMDGVTIIGGTVPFDFGNQQYAINELTIVGTAETTTCMNLFWGWTLTFTNLHLTNCPVGITYKGGQAGALVLVDATLSNVGVGIVTDYNSSSQPWGSAATLYLERLTAVAVPLITTGLPGGAGTTTIASWAQGPTYRKGALATDGQSVLPAVATAPIALPPRPTLAELAPAAVVNVLAFGAKGDGVADDTAALKAAIAAQPAGGAVFLPQGRYLVSGTLTLRADNTLLGEALSELRPSAAAALWADAAAPAPLLLLPPGGAPRVMDIILVTAGDVPGCVLLDWQSGAGTALWDVHARVYDVAHTITRVHGTGAAGTWANGWQWVADHDIDSGASLAVANPRGMLVEGIAGPLLLFAVAAEHSVEYQFNFTASGGVTQVTLQVETAYWLQPQTGWGLTIERATGPHVLYGGGAYSWGSQFGHGNAQTIVQVVNSPSAALYSLNTVGSVMLEVGDVTIAANATTDKAPFCSTAIAILSV